MPGLIPLLDWHTSANIVMKSFADQLQVEVRRQYISVVPFCDRSVSNVMVESSVVARASSAYSGQARDVSDIFIHYRFAPVNAEGLTIAFNVVEAYAMFVYAAAFRIHIVVVAEYLKIYTITTKHELLIILLFK